MKEHCICCLLGALMDDWTRWLGADLGCAIWQGLHHALHAHLGFLVALLVCAEACYTVSL